MSARGNCNLNSGKPTMSTQQLIAFLQAQMAQLSNTTHTHMDNSTIGISCSVPNIHSSLNSHTWIIDSGTTSHIFHSLHFFDSLKSLENQFVILHNNCRIAVKGIGNVSLEHDIILQVVLYMPTFHVNLISVSSLISHSNCVILFCYNSFLIQAKNKLKGIGKGSIYPRLYLYAAGLFKSFTNKSLNNKNTICNSVRFNATIIWHARLGHLSD